MLLRKLIVAVCPLAVCALVCAAFRWLDGALGSTAYASFVFKGMLLGAALALTLPIAGVKAYTNGLAGWLLAGAALLTAALLYQYLETTGAVHVPARAAHRQWSGGAGGKRCHGVSDGGGALVPQTLTRFERISRSMYSPLVIRIRPALRTARS